MNRFQRAILRLVGVKARPSEWTAVWRDGQPVAKPWTGDRAVREGFKASGVVATALTWRRTLATVPLRAYRRNRDGGFDPQPESELQKRLDRPNEFMSPRFLGERVVDHVLLGGNAFLLKNRGASGGKPIELWPLQPKDVTPIRSRMDFLAGYEINTEEGKKRVPAKDVIHFMNPDPSSDYWGLGVLEAGWETVDSEKAALSWQNRLLRNQAIAPGALGIGENLDDFDRLKAELEERKLGGGREGEILFLDGVGTISYQRMGLNVEEMALVDSRRLTREDIMSMFMVPPPLMGYLERANYANIETARRIFWQDTQVPFGQGLAQTWTSGLASEYGPEWVVDYDFSQVDALQENLSEKLANFKTLLDAKVKPEVAAEYLDLGLPDDAFKEPEPNPFTPATAEEEESNEA